MLTVLKYTRSINQIKNLWINKQKNENRYQNKNTIFILTNIL